MRIQILTMLIALLPFFAAAQKRSKRPETSTKSQWYVRIGNTADTSAKALREQSDQIVNCRFSLNNFVDDNDKRLTVCPVVVVANGVPSKEFVRWMLEPNRYYDGVAKHYKGDVLDESFSFKSGACIEMRINCVAEDNEVFALTGFTILPKTVQVGDVEIAVFGNPYQGVSTNDSLGAPTTEVASKKMSLKLGDRSYGLSALSIDFSRYTNESGEIADSIYGGYLNLRVDGTADSQLLRLASDAEIGTDGQIVLEGKNEMPISFTKAKVVSFSSNTSYFGKPVVNIVLEPEVLDIMGIVFERPITE